MSATEQTKTPEEVARSYFEALASRDLDAACRHWRSDGIEDVIPLRVLRGVDEIRGFLSSLMVAMPDLEMTVTRVTADERRAVVEWHGGGTFSGGQFEGIDPTGAAVRIRSIDVLEVEDGEIVSNTVYYDGMEFARAVGMLPGKDSGAERAMITAFNGANKVRALVREQINRG
jgi:steroid delta-isomerase-like uncharacterized protein